MPLALPAARPLEGELFHGELPEGLRRAKQLHDGTFVTDHTTLGRGEGPARGRERIPRVDFRRTRLTGGGAAVLAGAAAAPVAVRDSRRLRQHPDRRPSAGRYAAGTQFGAYHAAIAGKKGHKLRSAAPFIPAAVVGNHFVQRAMAPHLLAMQRDMYAGAGSARTLGHFRRAVKASVPATAAMYGANALITRHNASLGRYKEQTMAKSDTVEPTGGRYVAGAVFGPWHGAVAGKPGRKLRAAATEAIPGMLANPVSIAGALHGKPGLQALGGAAKLGGRLVAVQHNQRAGNLKAQPVRKDMPVTNVRYVVQRTPDGRYAGNGNDLTYVRVITRARRGSDAAPTVVHRGTGRSGGRAAVSVSHGNVAKAGGLGRRFAGALGRDGLSRTERALNYPGGTSLTTRGGRNRRAVLRGLEQVAALPKPTSVPKQNLTGALTSRMSTGGTTTSGRRIG